TGEIASGAAASGNLRSEGARSEGAAPGSPSARSSADMARGGAGATDAGQAGAGIGSAAPSTTDVAALPSDWVFDEAELRSYELTLDPAAWETLQQNALDEQYAEADLRIDDIFMARVGLRFKGSLGTLASCFADDGTPRCSKLSMKLKFDEYLPEQRFFGLKRLNFNSMVLDPSLLRERLAYRLFRELGIVAPRAVHARLSVNGESLGVFSLVEAVDGRFTDDHFVGGDGNLYKEAWPDTDDTDFLDRHLETNEDLPDHSLLLQFQAELAAASDEQLPGVVARYLDLDRSWAYLAVDESINDWDGPSTFYCYEGSTECENHNYYLYQHENEARFTLIPWDLDNTFTRTTPLDDVPGVFQFPADCTLRYQALGKGVMPPACDPLWRGVALSDRSGYLGALERLLSGPFAAPTVDAWLADWQAQIEPEVAKDEHGPGLEEFHAALEELAISVRELRSRAQAERD
ncbi:MAG TPA: CotH kinase family protein, partial [Polyangiaceae bacterium]|nr:CotH kinase family protein [Polyangiaceae bacterium]